MKLKLCQFQFVLFFLSLLQMYFFSEEYMYKQCMLTSVREVITSPVLFQKQKLDEFWKI